MSIKQTPIKVWNQWDEFGILAGLAHWSDDDKTLEYVRYPGESNKFLKDRILTANKYRGNATIQGMLNNISRDLGISISGFYTLPLYNTETKNFFYLSETPYPDASGIKVFVSTSGSWSSSNEISPQVRASGYQQAMSGWIVWNLPDFDASLIPSGLPGSSGWYAELETQNPGSLSQYVSGIQVGEYTRILEFIGDSIPNTGERIRVDYQVQTGVDLYGSPILNWRSDFSNIDDVADLRFVGKKSEFPTNSGDFNEFKSGHISIFSLDQLTHPTISGLFYGVDGKPTAKLIDLGAQVNNEYPLYWNKFRYDIGRWDQLDMASAGSIPSFHNETISTSGYVIKGGSKYGIDLDCVELQKIGSSVRSPWYPVFIPGEFYIGQERFYMFGSQQYQVLTLVDIGGGVLSGHLTGSVSGWPNRLGMIAAYSSGRFFNDSNLPNNPYIKRLHDFTNVISGVYYRSPYVDYSSMFNKSKLDFNRNNFYYDYTTGSVYASGINPTGFIVAWEHPGTYISGNLTTYSGGYGLNSFDFNPLTDPFDKVLYLN